MRVPPAEESAIRQELSNDAAVARTSVSLPKPLRDVFSARKSRKRALPRAPSGQQNLSFAFRPLLLAFVAVVMVTTGQEIIENKIAHIITQSLASILVEAKMLTG